MTEPGTVAMAVVVCNGHVLLVRRRSADGSLSWQFPAAAAEPGESTEEAAVREVFRQTGVQCAARHVLGGRAGSVTGRRVIYLLCDFIRGAAQAPDEGTITDVVWAVQGGLQAYASDSVQAYLDILARQRRHAASVTEDPGRR